MAVGNAPESTRLLAQTTLRTVLGTHTLAEILSQRERISKDMQVENWHILGKSEEKFRANSTKPLTHGAFRSKE